MAPTCQDISVVLPVLLLSPGQLLVAVCLGRPDLGPAVDLPVPLVGGDGEGHALPNDGRRATASVGPLLIRASAGSAQEPTLGCPGPCIPHCLCSWGFHPGFHPGLPMGRPVHGGVLVATGPLGWTLAGLRVRDGPGLFEGLDRFPERSQAEGKPDSPMRWQDADGQNS